MAKSTRRKTDGAVRTAADRSSNARLNRAAQVKDSDVARRAYDLYLGRGCAHGHDVEDWLQAERELEARSIVA